MEFAYGRVSTVDQNPDMQRDAFLAAGIAPERVYIDKRSGKLVSRPELDRVLEQLRKGDRLTVWKLDRLGRSTQHLMEILWDLRKRGIGFRSLTEGIDTSDAGGLGDLLYMVLAWFAEQEHARIIERTRAGLEAARRRGRTGGARPKMTAAKLKRAHELIAETKQETDELTGVAVTVPRFSKDEVAAQIGVHRSTLYKHLAP